jgi:hypothetical protein
MAYKPTNITEGAPHCTNSVKPNCLASIHRHQKWLGLAVFELTGWLEPLNGAETWSEQFFLAASGIMWWHVKYLLILLYLTQSTFVTAKRVFCKIENCIFGSCKLTRSGFSVFQRMFSVVLAMLNKAEKLNVRRLRRSRHVRLSRLRNAGAWKPSHKEFRNKDRDDNQDISVIYRG